MRLKNKKTGEVQDSEKLFSCYESLKELSEYWEDYPSEPLIKDEKIRKAVRAWAVANEFELHYRVKYCSKAFSLMSWQADIEFNSPIKDLEDEEEYTISALCGEEEE